jgi:hypothetical protein
MKKYFFIGAALIALGFGAISARESSMNAETNAQQPTRVSLVQLIANPQEYDGKFVRVIGFVSVEHEGTAVYLHQEDYKYDITENAVWLDIDFQRNKKFDQRYALIEGTFDAKHSGHKRLFSGSLKDVKRLQLWP